MATACDDCVLISSNDGNVYGEFGVINASVSAVSSGGIITRSLSYVIVRSGGGTTASSVVLQVLHRYDQVRHEVNKKVGDHGW